MTTFPPTPNLDVLVGRAVSERLLAAAGGLLSLQIMSAQQLRHLGRTELMAVATGNAGVAVGSSSSMAALAGQALHVHGGFILEGVLLRDLLGDDVAGLLASGDVQVAVLKKAVDALGAACTKAVKIDFAGGHRDGAEGRRLAEGVRTAVEQASRKGRVDAAHVKALDAIETRKDAEDKKSRGGRREADRRRRIAGNEDETEMDVIVRILQRHLQQKSMAHLGEDEEARLDGLVASRDVRAEAALELNRFRRRRAGKRARGGDGDGPDDSRGGDGVDSTRRHATAHDGGLGPFLAATYGRHVPDEALGGRPLREYYRTFAAIQL